MIKLVYCLRKRADMPEKEFRRYWRVDHAPLVTRLAQAIRAKKYIQSYTVEPELNALLLASRGLATPYDGITEVWWDDADSLRAALASKEGQAAFAALLQDEAKFIDFSQSRVFITEEHPIFEH
ncbi:MAG: hypothetical protein JWR16_1272 [Nevskia sp.]|nr:hypothetical protein [Nevskia sp.]